MRWLVLSFLLLSCGVKTHPRSSILESPPPIPFKDSAQGMEKRADPPIEKKAEGEEDEGAIE